MASADGLVPPRECIETATRRLKVCRAIDSEVAEFFRERVAIEVAYAKGLEQLSKRNLSVPNSELGGFADVWNKVLVSTAEEAQIHHRFAIGMSDKVSSPLTVRLDSDSDWKKQRTYEVELGKFLREFEMEEKRIKKDGGKGIGLFKNLKAKKAEDLSPENSRAIEAANRVFLDQIAPIFKKFEQMDKARKSSLNFNVTQFCEVFAAMVKPLSEIPDRLLVSAVAYDVEADRESFASVLGMGSTVSEQKLHQVPDAATPVQALAPDVAEAPAPMVDAEGYTIVPNAGNSSNPPWATSNRAQDFDSSDEEDGADNIFEVSKIKVEISNKAIQDDPTSALDTMRSLAAALPSKKKVSRQPGSDLDSGSVPPALSIPYVAQTTETHNPGLDLFNEFFGSPAVPAAPSAQVPKLYGSIVETVNVLIREGAIEKLLLTGEIFISMPQASEAVTEGTKAKLSIHGTDAFANFIADETLATVYSGPEGKGLEVDLFKLAQLTATTSGNQAAALLAKYQVQVAEDDVDYFAPILANPMWRCDASSAALLFAFQYNEDLITKLNLSDVRVLATLADGGDLGAVQMKPEGLWSPQKRSILWNVGTMESEVNNGDLSPRGSVLTSSSVGDGEPMKLMARFETSAPSSAGTISIQFRAEGGLLSGIDIDFGPEQFALLADVSKVIVSGKYACLA
ncbi:hypothetical protein HDU77_003672 [Chytriomyces hyalinus]|nr:hypothetical protein HDU77_003672 [Chytriomyces hyalinus]